MHLRSFICAGIATLLAACSAPQAEDFASYVNPKIGTGGHGHVFVGANVPFGMVQLGPTSIPQQWDWCSGYHDSDSTVIGFSHTHLSGTGIGDLFDITVMPVIGPTTPERGAEDRPDAGAWSYADRSREVCQPGYYSVPLTRYGILAELTATARVGFHRYTFPASKDAALVFDLENGGCWDKVTDAGFELVRNDDDAVTAIGGYRYSTGWAKDQKIYFWAEFSRPSTSFSIAADHYGRYGLGNTKEGETVLVKVALSPISADAARANLHAELPGWDFDATRAAAREAWNQELSKIQVTTQDKDRKTVFYTALYHTMIAPSLFNDADGKFIDTKGMVQFGRFQNYTTFSLWDTYRAAMPLMTLIHPEKCNDITATMYFIYRGQGDLPVWHLMGNETDCMVGNPGLIAFADNIVKGFTAGIDAAELMDIMTATAEQNDRGLDLRRKYGFIPADLYAESVATDMEYAIADAALANAAAVLGYPEIEAKYREMSHSYRHFWDPETQFLRGRRTDGRFTEPFDPIYSRHETSDYTEGTAWQYLWLVPQDVDGLVQLFGSKEATLAKLDGLFEAPDHVEGENASPDISGLIGQYAHGNEPGHHTIYLYSMLGARDKAADRLRQVYDTLYTNDVEGLAGNEDVGQMSAWYVLSSMGFYQVEPASTRFWFGTPLFEKEVVKVAGGEFIIEAKGLSEENRYIGSIKLNGQPYDKPYIEYQDIVSGGKLEYIMEKKKHVVSPEI